MAAELSQKSVLGCVRRKLRGSGRSGRSGSGGSGSGGRSGSGSPGRQVSPGDDAAPPGSASGSDGERLPGSCAADRGLDAQTERNRTRLELVRLAEEEEEEEEEDEVFIGMGNTWSGRERQVEPDLPRITVSEARPHPEEGADLPGPDTPGLSPTQRHPETPGLSPTQRSTETPGLSPTQRSTETPGLSPTQRHPETPGLSPTQRHPETPGLSPTPWGPGDDESRLSQSESEGSVTPTHSRRRRFIRTMICSSPEVRRSVHLSSSDSLASGGGGEDERTPVTLDPAEHEWMMCASDGEWASLRRLLAAEPALVQKRDFVTGFTCLHWAAKRGAPELLARILDFAEERGVPAGVDARSSMGYTPLHVAAMHGHAEVVKLLVGAFGADVELRDHSGRKACQYLADGTGVDIRDIAGAREEDEDDDQDRGGDEGRWRFSRVLQSNLRPLRLGANDPAPAQGRVREKPVRRTSSLSVMKPKLLRLRSSQIVHSSSFNERDAADVSRKDVSRKDVSRKDVSRKGSFRSRPHTHFFG